jgi:hypothetical protein
MLVSVRQLEQRLLGFGLDRFSCDAAKPLGTLSPIPAVAHQNPFKPIRGIIANPPTAVQSAMQRAVFAALKRKRLMPNRLSRSDRYRNEAAKLERWPNSPLPPAFARAI